MVQNNIHNMIEKYFEASLNEQEETQLRLMLAHTIEDTEDIREAKAILGVFATNRKLTGKRLSGQKPKTVWGKMKYAAILVLGFILDAVFDFDDSI